MLVERVRRRAHGDACGPATSARPQASAPSGCTPTARSWTTPIAIPASRASCCTVGELLVDDPLQPPVEQSTSVEVHPRRRRHGRGPRGSCSSVGPLVPGQPVLLGERAPGGEVDQALRPPARRTRRTRARAAWTAAAGRRSAAPPTWPARTASRSMASVGVEGARVVGVPLQQLALGRRDVADLGDVLDPDVDRVDEPPGRRQVGRGLHRRHRLGGVQRVDQDEVRAEVARRPAGQLAEVGQVADAPGAAASARSTAGSSGPNARPAGQRRRQLEPGRGDDQRGRGGRAAARDGARGVCQPERQVARAARTSPRPTSRPSMIRGGDPVVDLAHVAAAAVLQVDPRPRRCSPCGRCTGTHGVHPSRHDDHRRQQPPPRPVGLLRPGRGPRRRRRTASMPRARSTATMVRRAARRRAALPVVVLGGDALGPGQVGQHPGRGGRGRRRRGVGFRRRHAGSLSRTGAAALGHARPPAPGPGPPAWGSP